MSGTVGIRRDILKWLMTLNLSYPLKNAKRDFSNGFLVAEILSRYFPKDIEMHSYDTGTSLAKKKDNWALIEKFLKKKKMGVAFSGKEIEDVVNCEGDHPGVALLEKMYKVLGKARIGGDVCEAPDPVVPTPEFVPASKQAVPRPGGILMRPQQEGAPAGIHFSAQPSLQTPAPSQAPPSRHPHHHQDIDNSYDGGYYQTQSQPNCDAPHGHPGRGYSSQGHPGGGYSSQGHPGGCFNSQGHLGGPPLHLLGPRPGTPPEERERNRQQSMAEGAGYSQAGYSNAGYNNGVGYSGQERAGYSGPQQNEDALISWNLPGMEGGAGGGIPRSLLMHPLQRSLRCLIRMVEDIQWGAAAGI